MWFTFAAVLAGSSPDSLLQTYSQERLPVIRSVVRFTHLITAVMGTPNPLAQLLRDGIFPLATRVPALRQGIIARLSELGIAYRRSSIVASDRCRDRCIEESDGRFAIVLENLPATWMSAFSAKFAANNALGMKMRTTGGAATCTVVRPDGYRAYRRLVKSATNHRLREELARVSRVLSPQTGPTSVRP